jgi:putative ABC transport system ATP-binding protein
MQGNGSSSPPPSHPNETLIRARDLTKTYQMGTAEVRALRGVDLDIAHGEFVAIMGASGSGKSTMLHLLGCLDRPSAGSYCLDGTAVESLDDDELSRLRSQRVGFVFQSFNLIPQHTVLENVELSLIYAGIPKVARRERSLQLLEQVGLGAKIAHRPTQLSGGEQQRVAIARALSVDPPLLLADEPTGNLDTATGESVMKIFRRLNEQGTTVVIVTHGREIADQTRRVIEMRDGRIIADSTSGADCVRAVPRRGARR